MVCRDGGLLYRLGGVALGPWLDGFSRRGQNFMRISPMVCTRTCRLAVCAHEMSKHASRLRGRLVRAHLDERQQDTRAKKMKRRTKINRLVELTARERARWSD